MREARGETSFTIVCRFHGELSLFLRRGQRAQPVTRVLHEKTSVKDALEACGIPHPEIDLIVCNGTPVEFRHQLVFDVAIDVYGVADAPDHLTAARLQPRRSDRFVADGHLGKLVRDLRLLGVDVAYTSTVADAELVRIAAADSRAVLTRDRRLLMHSAVTAGYWLRSQIPEAQTIEVLLRFQLHDALRPFSRCLRCNAALTAVRKSDVLERLEPLTRMYYDEFRRCSGCGAVYWPGSHFAKLQARVDRIIAALQERSAI